MAGNEQAATANIDVMLLSEAELWRRQSATAGAALDFAISFLGCRMGPGSDRLLTSDARNRVLDILRAVSIVESRHGTQGPQQPARDPIQCGNPRDSWWRELTGQSGQSSRFIRGPGLTNLWANQVAAEAERTAGFDRAAALGRLANRNDGHRDAGFATAHSYVWGTIYLIHRINTAAGADSYACGDLARARLIRGAVAYNGGGVEDYEQRILAALDEFGGLARPATEALIHVTPVPEPTPQPEPNVGISVLAAIAIMVLGAIAALALGWFRFDAFQYVRDFTTEAPRVVTTLTVIALFMERALAALNTAWLADERERVRARMYAAEAGGAGISGEMQSALRAQAVVKAKEQRLRVALGFIFGLVISGAGVRTLAPLIIASPNTVSAGQEALLNSVDIILTAGLLAGGSEALSKLAELIREAVDATITRFRLNRQLVARSTH